MSGLPPLHVAAPGLLLRTRWPGARPSLCQNQPELRAGGLPVWPCVLAPPMELYNFVSQVVIPVKTSHKCNAKPHLSIQQALQVLTVASKQVFAFHVLMFVTDTLVHECFEIWAWFHCEIDSGGCETFPERWELVPKHS